MQHRPAARGRGSVGRASPCQGEGRGFESRRPLGGAGSRLACRRSARLFGTGPAPWGSACGGMAEWLRQGPAKPCTRVRFPLPPRGRLAQRESASLTRKRPLVQSQYRPPVQRSCLLQFAPSGRALSVRTPPLRGRLLGAETGMRVPPRIGARTASCGQSSVARQRYIAVQ